MLIDVKTDDSRVWSRRSCATSESFSARSIRFGSACAIVDQLAFVESLEPRLSLLAFLPDYKQAERIRKGWCIRLPDLGG